MKIFCFSAPLLIVFTSLTFASEPPAEDRAKAEAAAKKALSGKELEEKLAALDSIAAGKIGDKTFIPLVLPYLKDQTQASEITIVRYKDEEGEPTQMEVRDFALAAMLALTKQAPKSYGLIIYNPMAELMPDTEFPTLYFFLGGSKARDEAFSKWEKWAQENLKDVKPEEKVVK